MFLRKNTNNEVKKYYYLKNNNKRDCKKYIYLHKIYVPYTTIQYIITYTYDQAILCEMANLWLGNRLTEMASRLVFFPSITGARTKVRSTFYERILIASTYVMI